MNRVIVTLLACLTFLGWGVSFAHAQAVVQKGLGCQLVVWNGSSFIPYPGTGRGISAGNAADKNSKVNNFAGTCRGQLPPHLRPSRKVHYNFANTGIWLGTADGRLTDQWSEVITPSGKVTLKIQVNPSH